MKKMQKDNRTLEERMEDFGTKLLLRRYNLDHRPINSLSDIFFYVKEYLDQYDYYVKELKHNRCNVSDEAHFIFNLSFIDSIKFTILLHQEFGFFYYPGICGDRNDTFYDKRYYEIKKEFISKKYNIPYVRPKAKVSYILCSVFPSKEIQDICYGALNGNIDQVEDTQHNSDNSCKLDNYFDDSSRILNFYDSEYYEGYKRTKSNK